MVFVLVVLLLLLPKVVVERWAGCRMRPRHYVSMGEFRQSAEALTGWCGGGRVWFVRLCLACWLLSDTLRSVSRTQGQKVRERVLREVRMGIK